MDVSLQQLRMLREVARHGTIAAAAGALGYTPSAVSQQLAGLERATGVPVLERVGRNVRLTDAGRELVRHAGELLARLEAAHAAMERVNGAVQGTVELAVFESVATTILVPLLELLARRAPDLEVHTRQEDPDAALEALEAGELDLVFTLEYPHAPARLPAHVVRRPVLDDVFHLVVPADDPLAARPVTPLASLAGRRLVASPPWMSCGRCIVTACRAAGFEPDVAHAIDDYRTTLLLVRAGAGVALVPELALTDLPPGLRVVGVDPAFSRTIQLAHRAASAERPAVAAVCAAVDEVVAGLALPRSNRQRHRRRSREGSGKAAASAH